MRKHFLICFALMLCLCLSVVVFSGCGGSTGGSSGGNVTPDPAAEFTLVVTIAPQGAGSVMLDPAGGKYKSGTNVILRPVANDGYDFIRWDGDNKADLVADYDYWKIKMNGHKKIIATFAELLPNQVASPTAIPVGGMVADDTEITLSVTTEGATIYYTTDDSTPTSASTIYNASAKPTVPAGGLILKAIAAKAGMIDSNVVTFRYSTPRPIEQQSYEVGEVSFNMRLAPGGLTFPYGMFDDTTTINHDYWISETEVTCELWYTVRSWASDPARGDQRYFFQSDYFADPPIEEQKLKPVFYISWRDAIVWCNALTEYYNATNGKALACVYTYGGQVIRDSRNDNSAACDQAIMATGAKGFRLPISKEWEMAARYIDGINWLPYNHVSGDTSGNCYPGVTSTRVRDYVWFAENSEGMVHPVATRLPNHLGLYDMSGNLNEFCFEKYSESDIYRVLRGGHYASETGTYSLLVSYENRVGPDYEIAQDGFRFVATK